MSKLAVAIILLLFCSYPISAQSVCESIIRSANYNQYQSVAQSQQYSLQKANFCLAEYNYSSNEKKAQIEASYKLFSGGASGSQAEITERQRQECDNKYGEYWFNQLGLMNQKIVSDKAMETVARCIEALASGLRVEPTFTESEEALSISLTWNRANDLPFKGVIRAPAANVSCKLDGKDTDTADLFNNRIIKPATSVTFTCERTITTESISGEQVRCLPPALVAIDVLESPVTINLFRRCETDFLISRAAEVDRKLADMGQRLNAQNETYNTQINETKSKLNAESKGNVFILAHECPLGWYANGRIGIIMASASLDAVPFERGAPLPGGWTWIHPVLCQKAVWFR